MASHLAGGLPLRLTLVPVLFLPLVVLACGDEGEGGEIDVTLSEWEVVLSHDTVPEGPVTFNVDNEGEEEHELVIIRTDFDPAELPTKDDGSVDEGADGLDKIGETDEIDAGDDDSRVFTLDPGNYVLVCNIVEEHDETEAHYAMGMFTSLAVTADE